MGERWQLSRAGITNVYQYDQETLHFAGGRLLLRGVNGSGKSTAMNMLLPFLFEADTRRIDAAGEQQRVLRGWMLTGREEQQPIGYLWIELARGTEHRTFGCGLKANRSTEQVKTWWFATDRRPGVDLDLVVGRQPLGVEALRTELGAGFVFNHDQRAAYRLEVRNLLYGGADLDQHLRLLHVVRNPRVGDRIDVELPTYLTEALPQLSDDALDDAAQPLEDLEEHRRNVEQLSQTATALDAIEAVYRSYARSEVHRRADQASSLVSAHGAASRATSKRQREHEASTRRMDEADDARNGFADEAERLREEIRALEASDAFKQGAELNHLRDLVRNLDAQVEKAADAIVAANGRVQDRRDAATSAAGDTDRDANEVRAALAGLMALAAEARLSVRPPDVHLPDRRAAHGTDPDGPAEPTEPFVAEDHRAGIAELRAAAQHRGGDIAAVRDRLGLAESAENALARALERQTEAATRTSQTEAQLATADEVRRTQLAAWSEAFEQWEDAVLRQRADDQVGMEPTGPDARVQPTGPPEDRRNAGLLLVQGLVDHHDRSVARLAVDQKDAEAIVDDRARALEELRARTLPDPPSTRWQRSARGPVLAELVDFHADVSATDRLGIEAALLASGLLGAEIRPDGSVVSAAGDLVLRPGRTVAKPLASRLKPDIPERLGESVDHSLVASVLQCISIDPDRLAGDDDHAVVTSDGRFRLGPLRGEHVVERAEHVGTSARRAALDRQRAEASTALEEAAVALDAVRQELVRVGDRRSVVAELRSACPALDDVVRAGEAFRLAQRSLDVAAEELRERQAQHRTAEEAHARAEDEVRRVARNHQLPADRPALDELSVVLGGIAPGCDHLDRAAAATQRSVERWQALVVEWHQARTEADAAAAAAEQAQGERQRKVTELATLEDAIGLEHAEVVQAIDTSQRDLVAAAASHDAARAEHLSAVGGAAEAKAALAQAAERETEADEECRRALPQLRAAAGVPGFLRVAATPDPTDDDRPRRTETQAVADDSVELPSVDASPAGLGELVDRLRELVLKPTGEATTAEGVRQSLRQRRDALGAGWDAADHQPDDHLPLHVEVNGPTGRAPLAEAGLAVREDLSRRSSLLSVEQDQALRNLLQGLVAREVAQKLHAARELVNRINRRLETVRTSQGIGVSLRWKRRDDLDADLAPTVDLLAKLPDLRTEDEDQRLSVAVAARIAEARREDPERPYRELIGEVLDYRSWHRMTLVLHRPGRPDEVLSRRTALSEGEKKMVSYLPLFAAVAASSDALAEAEESAPRFVLLDDAFAKVSEDNHAKLFGLLVDLDLDFIATSERLWGTHQTVPQLAITEVIRDASLGAIVLEHSHWDGTRRQPA